MLASCSPFAQGAIERAIDRFLSELGASETTVHSLPQSTGLIPAVMFTAGAIAVIETARRRFSSACDLTRGNSDEVLDEALALLPGRRQRWELEEI
jgi:hypothetical protein